jgi:hypothetical protein
MTTATTIDWAVVDYVAARLGAHTRRLVAERDPDAVFRWVERMSREHSGPASATYFELAMLVRGELPEEEGDDDNE